MSRIPQTFSRLQAQKRKALIPFVTAGDPDRGTSVAIMNALVSAGADIIELGVPFSDPMADGPTIQRSSERALKHGTSLEDVLGIVKAFRAGNEGTPVVLMGYANPIESMGHEVFAKAARAAGVDGVLVVDYPPEEGSALVDVLKAQQIDSIFLLSPTTDEKRMAEVGRLATGYIYYVSLKGVTGAAHLDLQEVAAKIPRIRSHIRIPIGVGFGIRDGETAKAIASVSDAVVIGSRLVQEIESSPADKLIGNISSLLGGIRRAMDGA